MSYQVFAQEVNPSTGTGSVTISIYTLQEGSIGVPISISYDASGVPVNTQASNVGLNWGLMAGGKIVRTVRRYADDGIMGLADRDRGGIYYYDDPAPNEKFEVITDTERDIFTLILNGSTVPFIIRYPTGGTGPQIIYLKQNTDITIELVDVSYSKLNGPQTNTYTFDELVNAVLGAEISGKKKFITFKVTTTDGLVYYFGENSAEREYGFTYNQFKKSNFLYPSNLYGSSLLVHNDFSAVTVNTWNLSRIVKPRANDANNPFQEVKFYYKRVQQMMDTYGYTENFIEHIPSGTCTEPAYSRITDKKEQPITFLSQLDKIVSANFEVRFNDNVPIPSTPQIKTIIPDYDATADGNFADKFRFDTWRIQTDIPSQVSICCTINAKSGSCYQECNKPNPILEIPAAEALKNIVIVDKSSTDPKKLGYFFHHSYFNIYYLLQMNNGSNRRNGIPDGHLKLLGIYPIKFLSNNGGDNITEIAQGYTFKYNNITLPRKESVARDAWGYYNGKDENETAGKGFWAVDERHPYIEVGQTQPKFKGVACPISFVEPILLYAQAASLHTVVNPTGGWSQFEFELHDCDNYFAERTLVNGLPKKVGVKNVGGLRVNNIKTYDPVTNQIYTKKYTYTKKNSTESSGFLSILPSVIYNQFVGGQPSSEYFAPGVWSQLASTYINGSYISYRFVKEEMLDANGNNNGYIEYEFYNNEKQPYLIKSSTSSDLIEDDGVTISKCYDRYYRLDSNNPLTDDNIPVFDFLKGSIKSQRIYDKNDKLLSETEYTYEVTDLTIATVGTLGRISMVPTTIDIEGHTPIKFPWKKEVNYVSSGLNYIGMGFQIVSNNAAAIYSGLASQGMGLQAASFAAKSASMANIATILNGISTYIGIALTVIDIINAVGYHVDDNSEYYWRNYKTPVGKVNLTKTISRSYNTNDNNFIETVSEYKFESPNHSQMTSSKTYVASAGVAKTGFPVYENKILYNKDFTLPTSPSTDDLKGIEGLNTLKVITPIENVSFKNNKVIGGSYIEFYPSSSNYVGMPSKSYSLEITRPLSSFSMSEVTSGALTKNANYVSQVDYLEYNSRGLLSKVKGTNQIAEATTQFGYNNYIPTSSTFGTASLNMTTTNEYIPLFGVTKTTAPDNNFVTTSYDELGRVSAIKDFKGDTRKSFAYNTVLPTPPNNDITFKLLRSVNDAEIMSIENNTEIISSTIPTLGDLPNNVNIKAIVTGDVKSVVFELVGPVTRTSTDVDGSLWRVFEIDTNGFNVNDSTVKGEYTLLAKSYSKPQGRGELISIKKVNFRIL
ncbi:hypothetical protein D0T08_18360 [Emticicia sp. C21]|nr:hypothetical protein D0T08_18360 [Emticicia sp. C21]